MSMVKTSLWIALFTVFIPFFHSPEANASMRLINFYADDENLRKQFPDYINSKKSGNKTLNHEISAKPYLRDESAHKLSSIDLYKDGKLHIRRYYDIDGNADEDVEYVYHKTPQKEFIQIKRYRWEWTFLKMISKRVPASM